MTDAEIPTHLAGPPDVPDKRVFELKAQMNALTKRLLAAEKQRDDADLYDDYDTQSEYSDRDVGGGGDDQWAGDDPNWTAA